MRKNILLITLIVLFTLAFPIVLFATNDNMNSSLYPLCGNVPITHYFRFYDAAEQYIKTLTEEQLLNLIESGYFKLAPCELLQCISPICK